MGDYFQQLQNRGEVQIEYHSCISLRLKPKLILPEADWIFFLSPSGVELFSEKFIPEKMKIGVIGPGTARVVIENGWQVAFEPHSTDPEDGIDEFAQVVEPSEVVIMACSDKSLKRMHGVIPPHRLIEWEFYENKPAQTIEKTEADYVVFTSPSNADAYLNTHRLFDYQVVVAIGKTTFEALKKRGISNEIIRAVHPTEESIWKAILSHFK